MTVPNGPALLTIIYYRYMAEQIARGLEPRENKSTILENESIRRYLEANKEVMQSNDDVYYGKERDLLKIDGVSSTFSASSNHEAIDLIRLEESVLRPFRINLYETISVIPYLEKYLADEHSSPQEWEFRQKHGRTHNFILASVRYPAKIKELESGRVDWSRFNPPVRFLGGAPNLLQDIQYQTSIRSPLVKRPELADISGHDNIVKYHTNPLYKYFIDQIFGAFDMAEVPYDAFEFRHHRDITKEHVISYLKVVGKMLANGYQSPYNSVMFSS